VHQQVNTNWLSEIQLLQMSAIGKHGIAVDGFMFFSLFHLIDDKIHASSRSSEIIESK
jgi:hypothetical protein